MPDYSWLRYWHRSHEIPRVHHGFLERIGEYERISRTFSDFAEKECLVLLGEPGIGKSREIEKIYASEVDDVSAKLYVNLNAVGSETGLFRRIFEAEKLQSWKSTDRIFYLYLDSLDEALLNINTLSGFLADEIASLPVDRLRLRVVCRSGEWAHFSTLDSRLRNLWKDEKFAVIQLAPLTAQDVYDAAIEEGLDADAFLRTIEEKNAGPLAAKPITLKLLINLFRKDKDLTGGQFDIYERGCLALAGENYATRRAQEQIDELSNEQRFRIAARIAALMKYSNKSSIWLGQDTGEQSNSDILISELSGFVETRVDEVDFQVTERDVRETLNKGLFTGDGSNRIKFAHQTFAEFLSAWYVNYKEVSDDRVLKLISAEQVHPQLYETSAWIAGNRPEIFRVLTETTPTVLLRSDVFAADDSLRFDLTSRLLQLFEKQELIDSEISAEYQRLSNSRIAEQLRPFIADKSKGWLLRRVAIDIAEACEVQELQGDLIKVVLDKDDDHHIRVNAAYAIKRIGDRDTKKLMLPLVAGNHEDDENLELKGVAMDALWKVDLSTDKLFDAYEEPKRNFLGSYKSFLYRFPAKLEPDDLTIALLWLKKRATEVERLSYATEELAGDIMLAAWNHLDSDNVFTAFVDTLLPYVKSNRQGFIGKHRNELDTADNNFLSKRRKVLVALLSSIDDQGSWFSLSLSSTFSFNPGDVSWVIEEWQSASTEKVKGRLLDLVKSWLNSTQGFYSGGAQPDFVSKVYELMQSDPKLRDEIGEFFEPIDSNSDKAEKLKELYAEWQESTSKWRREVEEPKDLVPSPQERMLACLERFEKGEIDGFWALNREMTLQRKSTHYGDELQSDLRRLPGWTDADEPLRERIVDAARDYLYHGDPKTPDWIGTNMIQFSAFSGYRALKLLTNVDPKFVGELPPEVWEKWTPIIYFYPIYNGSNQDEYHQHKDLVAMAYLMSPNSFPELIGKEIEKETTLENAHISFDKFEKCWDDRLTAMWRDRLADGSFPVSLRVRVFSQLLELHDEATKKIALDLIDGTIPTDSGERSLVSGVASLLVRHAYVDAWPRIQEILDNDADFGKEILHSGVSRFGGALLEQLSETQLRDLYLWLANEFPHSEDPDFSNETMAHLVGPREELGRWRDLVLDKLKDRGTKEAVEALEEILRRRPDLDWLRFTIIRAKDRTREKSWTPLPLTQLRQLLKIDRSTAPAIKVLFFAANPRNANSLALDEEARAIQNEISSNEYLQFPSRWATRPGDILKALNEEKPQIVHFSGHGNPDEMAFQDDTGAYVLVPKDTISKILSAAPNSVVFLNTCHSSQLAEELAKFVDVAVGMSDTIDDDAARVFAAQFYSAIGYGNSIKNAFEQAKAALALHGPGHDHIPKLFTKIGVVPENIILLNN